MTRLLLERVILIDEFMSILSHINKFLNSDFFRGLTLFQGSTVRYFYSYFFLNRGISPWLSLRGSSAVIDNIEYDYQLEKPRGRTHDGKFYSYGYLDSSEKTLQPFISIIKENLKSIENVLGRGFLLDKPTFWRTTFIPDELSSLDIYSQVFHQDSVVDNFNVQIFVLLHDVGSTDGPFEWIEKKYHRKAFSQCKQRNKVTVDHVPVCRLVGKKNDYLILSTGQNLHRDGIPAYGKERVLASIALFPRYTKIGKPLEAFL